jgi:hypothetical protein
MAFRRLAAICDAAADAIQEHDADADADADDAKNVKKCQKMSKILISDGLVLILDGEMTFPGERKNGF